MTQQEQIEYWITIAEHDIPVMDSLFYSRHYDWSLFIGHLVIEKILKACFVRDNNETPPKIHDLVKLAKSTKINFSEEQLLFLYDVTRFNLETRYTDYKLKFYKIATKEFTELHLNKIKEFYQWIKQQLM